MLTIYKDVTYIPTVGGWLILVKLFLSEVGTGDNFCSILGGVLVIRTNTIRSTEGLFHAAH